MKIAIVSTRQYGEGAANAAYSLFNALRKANIEATFIVAEGKGGENIIVLSKNRLTKIKYKIAFVLERLYIWITNKFSIKNLFAVSCANTGLDITRLKEIKEADIIHLHWINQGMLSINNIEKIISMGKPVVITTHDLWYATAICHYTHECTNHKKECMNCPKLANPGKNDLAHKIWQQKKNLYKENVTFVTLSPWTYTKIKESRLTSKNRTAIIANAVPREMPHNLNRNEERNKNNIEATDIAIAFCATKLNDPIKGADLLFKAISNSKIKDRIILLLMGSIKNDKRFLEKIPCRYIYYGSVRDKEEQAKIYSMADITAVPSHYETFSLVTAEAMLCGTPVIAFDNSAPASLIHHKEDGYLANYPDCNDLKNGIEWIASNSDNNMRERAHTNIRNIVSPENVAEKHIQLYKELLK